MRVMLLAAGRSTRLGSIGQILPKPLVPICGYPAIRFGIAACAAAGLCDIVINLFHHGDLIRQMLGDGTECGVRLQYSTETELLGTAGGIAHARARLGDGAVLVMNAKVVADVDLAALIRTHHQAEDTMTPPPEVTLLLRDDPRAQQWGPIGVDQEGRVVSILGSPAPLGSPGDGSQATTLRMFTGIQVVSPAMRDRMSPVPSDTVRDAYTPALLAGVRIESALLLGYFAEHSTPERYLAGNLALLRNPQAIRHPPGPLVGVDPAASVHRTAAIVAPVRIAAGAVIEAHAVVGPEVVVGAEAVVTAGARISRAVIWPRARVSGVVRDAVVTSDGVQHPCDAEASPPA
jgi:mannose-1-phosphate guanylyltransferase